MKPWLLIFVLLASRLGLPQSCPTLIVDTQNGCSSSSPPPTGTVNCSPGTVTVSPNQFLLLVVGQLNADHQTPVTTFTISSSAGFTYSNAVGGPTGNAEGNIMYAESGSFSGTETVTIHCTSNCGGFGTTQMGTSLSVWANIATASPLDQTATASGIVTNANVSSGSFMTTGNKELLIAYCNGGFFTGPTAVAGWTGSYGNDGTNDDVNFTTTGAAGSYTGQCHMGTTGPAAWVMAVASFKSVGVCSGRSIRHYSQVY